MEQLRRTKTTQLAARISSENHDRIQCNNNALSARYGQVRKTPGCCRQVKDRAKTTRKLVAQSIKKIRKVNWNNVSIRLQQSNERNSKSSAA